MKKYDSIIIGFGKAGKTLANYLANHGKTVALIEKSSKMFGGTCINVGCIPTKSLVNSSSTNKFLNDSYEKKQEYYLKAMEEKNRLTSMLRQKNYEKLANYENIDIIVGKASFINEHQISIETENKTETYSGEKIYINTGSKAFIPNIKGITDAKNVYTSETLLDLKILPQKLIIIGGGYIGLEFASIYRHFGSKVIVLQNENNFMPRDDQEMSKEIYTEMSKDIDFYFNAQIKDVQNKNEQVLVNFSQNGIEKDILGDALLVATGRRPNIEDLKLELAGVEIEKGAIKVDEYLKTTANHIYALGDCKGGLCFTYISLDDFRIIKSQLEGENYSTLKRGAIPYSMFINPTYSHIGMTEAEAREKNIEVMIAKLAVNTIPKAQVLRKPIGLLKAVIDKKTEMILGASFYCEESHELINIIKLAIDQNVSYKILRDQIYNHPTMSEALNDLFTNIH